MIARAIGLPVPDYAIVEIPDTLINPHSIPDERLRRLLRDNVGLNFGSVFEESARTWQPSTDFYASPEMLKSMECVLTFDSTVINGDRQAIKPNLLWNGSKLLLIDHSIAVPVFLWDDKTLLASPLFPEVNVREHCSFSILKERKHQYIELLQIWQERIQPKDFDNLRALIPNSFERREGDLDKIFQFLKARSSRFTDISEDLRRIVL